ncbi:MAG: nicotinamide mononucleotide transporter family protein [Actinomycetota bacterium]
MPVLNWLFDAQLVIAGHPILWREIIGNVFGFASAFGGMRRRVWAWPVGIVGNVLLFSVFVGVAFGNPQGATLWGQACRQVLFIAVSAYGWWRWMSNRRAGTGAAVVPRWPTGRERAAYLAIAAVSVAVGYVVFRAIGAGFPAPDWYYLADSWIFVGSALATYAMARGWFDFWLCWIAVDAVGVPELIHFRFYPSAVLYAIYAGFVVWGLVVWLRVPRVSPAADEVALSR